MISKFTLRLSSFTSGLPTGWIKIKSGGYCNMHGVGSLGHRINTIHDSSLVACMEWCEATEKCLTVSYNVHQTRECYLDSSCTQFKSDSKYESYGYGEEIIRI